MKRFLTLFLLVAAMVAPLSSHSQTVLPERADLMLLYQRSNGGWPQYHGDPTNYRLPLTDSLMRALIADKEKLDATIDDRSTTFEIGYLMQAWEATGNEVYREAAERGIRYLLRAQNPAGGWPQFFPDSSNYRIHITYNDYAMTDVMTIMRMLAYSEGVFGQLDEDLRSAAARALERGVDCILRTQVRQNGRLTVWCAQHDSQTLAPAAARTFEPASLSGSESVGIVRLLMSLDSPSTEVRQAIIGAMEWFELVRIDGWTYRDVDAPTEPTGRDRVLLPDERSSVWARFYELETNRPIFTGRDGKVRYELTEVENERRIGYAYYGKWPDSLLQKAYPAWRARWGEE